MKFVTIAKLQSLALSSITSLTPSKKVSSYPLSLCVCCTFSIFFFSVFCYSCASVSFAKTFAFCLLYRVCLPAAGHRQLLSAAPTSAVLFSSVCFPVSASSSTTSAASERTLARQLNSPLTFSTFCHQGKLLFFFLPSLFPSFFPVLHFSTSFSFSLVALRL